MSKLAFVDPHGHFYDMRHPELFYAHWQPGVPHPILGWQIQKLAEDYIAETRTGYVINRKLFGHCNPPVTNGIPIP